MRATIVRALIFAGMVLAVSLTVDLAFALFRPGGVAHGGARQFLVYRAALHGATFIMTALGATAGFAPLRSYSIAAGRIALLGGASGLVALAGVTMAVHAGGFRAAAACLIIGSAALAYVGGRLIGRKEAAA